MIRTPIGALKTIIFLSKFLELWLLFLNSNITNVIEQNQYIGLCEKESNGSASLFQWIQVAKCHTDSKGANKDYTEENITEVALFFYWFKVAWHHSNRSYALIRFGAAVIVCCPNWSANWTYFCLSLCNRSMLYRIVVLISFSAYWIISVKNHLKGYFSDMSPEIFELCAKKSSDLGINDP